MPHAQDTAAQIEELRHLLKSPERRLREQEQAYTELGPRFVERPISNIESQIPINKAIRIAATEGRLPAVVELARLTQMGRGGVGFGDPIGSLLQRLQRVAQRLNPAQAEDLSQIGALAAHQRMGREAVSGPELVRTAAGKMRHALRRPEGEGVRMSVADAIRRGEAAGWGEMRVLGEIRKKDPSFTLAQLRQAKTGIRQPMARLDAPSGREGETIGEGLRGLSDNPAQLAELKEAVSKLTQSEQTALLGRIQGGGRGTYSTAAADRALKKLGYGAEQPTRTAKPISGGAPGPEDLSAEFPASQFRVELGRQPRQQFGQEGFQVRHPGDPVLAQTLGALERLMAKTGGGSRRAPGAIPESQHHTLGAARLVDDWEKLRSILSTTGRFQGRN